MKRQLTALLLALVMVLGMLPGAALAASSVEEALGEVQIFHNGQEMAYLSINGRVREQTYTYYNFVDADGSSRQVPAYCVNPNTAGVPQTVPAGTGISYLANQKYTDPKVFGIVASGYPHRPLDELGLNDVNEGYYAAKQIYQTGMYWDHILEPRLTVEADRDTAYPVTVDGDEYLQQVFTVTSETWVDGYATIAFADPSAVPEGTRIIGVQGNDITGGYQAGGGPTEFHQGSYQGVRQPSALGQDQGLYRSGHGACGDGFGHRIHCLVCRQCSGTQQRPGAEHGRCVHLHSPR